MKETKSCPYCGEDILAVAKKCKHCKEFLEHDGSKTAERSKNRRPESTEQKNTSRSDRRYARIIGMIHRKNATRINYHPLKPLGLFLLTNIAVCLSVTIVTLGEIRLAILALFIGSTVPFVILLLSKFLAKLTHDIHMIDPNNFGDANERHLYFLVKALSQKAGLPKVPEIGIYKSAEMNAFATGRSRSSSMVAFSSAIVNKMDEDALAAVAAHEVAHIANGDMLSMTLMMSVVNTVIVLVNMAMFWIMHDHRDGILGYMAKRLIRFVVVVIMMFLGNLLMLWFSRHREFKADQMAAELVRPNAMIRALQTFQGEEATEREDEDAEDSEDQAAYASFKISSPPAICDLLSTHPSLERRIERLESI